MPPKRPIVHSLERWRVALLWPLSVLMKAWAGTIRMRGETPEDLSRIRDTSQPTLVLFWHNRLFMAAEGYRRFRRARPMHGLVSASKDGAWLAAFFQLAGLHSVRGSSSRRAMEAMRELVRRVRAGHDVTITPDGPRGPRYSCKAGPVMVARQSGARVLLVGIMFSRAWRLRSWDGFYLPVPFSRVTIRTEWIFPSDLEGSVNEAVSRLRNRLLALNGTGPEDPEVSPPPASS